MTNSGDKGDILPRCFNQSTMEKKCKFKSSTPNQDENWTKRPLAVSYKTAGSMIDRSSRTVARMVARGDLVDLSGQSLVTYKSLEDWVSRMSSNTN